VFVFTRAEDRRAAHASSPHGRWWLEGQDHDRVVVCNCPRCGADSQVALVVRSIADDGAPSPKSFVFVCPRGCGFGDAARLDGWAPPEGPDGRTL
jgi:hypothetical protein